MHQLIAAIFGCALTLAVASPALADPTPVPTSQFGGMYLMSSGDGQLVAFLMADGRVRWELDGLPLAEYGVNDVARAASLGFSDSSLLVLGGTVRGVYVASSADGSWIAYQMPDLSVRWEHNGVPATP
jgi:hypothetical protein